MITKITKLSIESNKIDVIEFHPFEYGLKMYNKINYLDTFEITTTGFTYVCNRYNIIVQFIDDDLDLINDYHD